MKQDYKVLFIVPAIPGYYTNLIHALAAHLRGAGCEVVFASDAQYYEVYRNVNLGELGKVYYFAEYLTCGTKDNAPALDMHLDYWHLYPSYERRRYFDRKPMQWEAYWQLKRYIRHVFDQESGIDLVVGEPPASAITYFAWAESHHRGIPYFGYNAARIPGYFDIQTDDQGCDLLENAGTEPPETVKEPPEYMNNLMNTLYKKSLFWEVPRLLNNVLRAVRIEASNSLEAGGNVIKRQIRAYTIFAIRQACFFYANKIAEVYENTFDPEPNRIAVLYPLHYHPEASTSVCARHHVNEEEVIRNIAFSLPDNAELYVKEHPSGIGNRPVRFYRTIESYPGVHVLGITCTMPAILHRFDAVVTLTSTAGFEALQLGIPVYLIGHVFYEKYPGVVKINSYEELNRELKKIRNLPAKTPNPEIFQIYQKYCFKGSFNYENEAAISDQNIALLAHPILDRLKKGTVS